MLLPVVTRPTVNARRRPCGCIDVPDNYRPGKHRASVRCPEHRHGYPVQS